MTRRRPSQIELSMFPFLSVLCVVIGILMLFMIVIIGTRVIGAEAEEQVVYRTPRDFGRDEAGEDQGPGIPEEQHKALSDAIRRLTTHLIHQQEVCDVLQQQHARLEDLIQIKRDEIAQFKALGPDAPVVHGPIGVQEKVRVVPDRRRKVSKKAILVEVDREGFVVHPQKTRHAVEEIDERNSPFEKFLKHVDSVRSREYLLLLLRPNGVASYAKLRKHLLEHYSEKVTMGAYIITKSRIDIGVEPFSPYWEPITRGQEPGS